jgi:hypothetical protein
MFSIDIFQNGANEEFFKLFQVTRGHSQGEIEALFFLLTNYGVYILIRKVTDALESSATTMTMSGGVKQQQQTTASLVKYNREAFIGHNQIDYIEVALNEQAFHLNCINKRQNCWITTASRELTK